MKKNLLLLLFGISLTSFAYAQTGSVTGTVVDDDSGEPLTGASVVIKGTTKGTVTDINGDFLLKEIKAGQRTIVISFIGFDDKEVPVTVNEGGTAELGEMRLASNAIGLEEVRVIASIAIDRKTPVAVSTLKSKQIEERVGNLEFPQVLSTTPSVYVTRSGGGFGDARINVRGFDQRNTAVLINGIPVNDMENGWVYWSNWAGLSDVSSSIQVQRGLGASKLAISSVGGTINVVTNPIERRSGGYVSVGVGNDGYLKYGAMYSTGKMDNGWAITLQGTRTTGNGYIDAAYIDAYSYFLTIGKELGDDHQLVFTGFGAPQKHGQRSFMPDLTQMVPDNGMTEDQYKDLIKESSVSDFDNTVEVGDVEFHPEGNVKYNSDWGLFNGEIYHIRENFYHKPQFSLNHYWDINENAFLGTTAYYSIGRGGGTGDRGRIGGRGPWGYRDQYGLQRIDDVYAWNSGQDNIQGFPLQGNELNPTYGYIAGERNGIIKRASMNEHNWFGIISKLDYSFNKNLMLISGIDLRHYVGMHYRKVVDLLGNDAWLEPRDVNQQGVSVDVDGNGNISGWETGYIITEEDDYWGNPGQSGKINYDNDGIVNWVGAFAELEYSQNDLTAFGSFSVSNTGYKRIDRFNYLDSDPLQETEFYSFPGFNVKGGANYNLSAASNVFFNTGFYSRAPIFDTVFPRFNNTDINADAENEKIIGLEAGYGYRSGMVTVNVNAYYTNWRDKALVRRINSPTTGNFFFANIRGLQAVHSGFELEAFAEPVKGLSLSGMISLGNWEWNNNVSADVFDEDNNLIETVEVFAEGLKVGDAAQTTFSLGADYTFDFGLALDARYFYFDDLYAQFDPSDRDDPTDKGLQALQLPAYGLLHGGLSYKFNISDKVLRLRLNVNNITNELYIAEAQDDASLLDTSGYFGFGRTWSLSAKFTF